MEDHGHIQDQEQDRDQDQDQDHVLRLALGLVGGNLGLGRLRTAVAGTPVLEEGSREIAEALAGEVCYNPHHHEEDQQAGSDHPGEGEDRRNWVGVAGKGPEDSPAGEGLRTEGTVVLHTKESVTMS